MIQASREGQTLVQQTTLPFAPVRRSNFAGDEVETYRVPVQLQPIRRAEMLAHLAGAFDLAEGQPVGHSVRVAHLASAFARNLRLDAPVRRRVILASLLHDAGVAVRTLPEGVDSAGGHTAAGAWVASLMGLDAGVQAAILASHERWDGDGRPHRLAMDDIPVEALLVGAAHWVADFLGPVTHPLRARSELRAITIDDLEPLIGLRVGHAVLDEVRGDAVWMQMWSDDLATQVAQSVPGEGRPTTAHVDRIASAVGEVVDAAVREPGRSANVAMLAMEIGRALGLDESYRRALRVAAQVLDIGQLGVPRHITEKPAILSVEEMEVMQHHPGWGSQLLERVPGFAEIARWVEAHHERPDGRGYPEQLTDSEVPLGARILAVADSFWALCAERPYRAAMSHADALAFIERAAGAQYDRNVVRALRPALAAMQAHSRRAVA